MSTSAISTVDQFYDTQGTLYTRAHGGVWTVSARGTEARIALFGVVNANRNSAFSYLCDVIERDDEALKEQLRTGNVQGLTTDIKLQLRPDKILYPVGFHVGDYAQPHVLDLAATNLPSNAQVYIGEAQVSAASVNRYPVERIDLIGTRYSRETSYGFSERRLLRSA